MRSMRSVRGDFFPVVGGPCHVCMYLCVYLSMYQICMSVCMYVCMHDSVRACVCGDRAVTVYEFFSSQTLKPVVKKCQLLACTHENLFE